MQKQFAIFSLSLDKAESIMTLVALSKVNLLWKASYRLQLQIDFYPA